jgi:gas vesicle protein
MNIIVSLIKEKEAIMEHRDDMVIEVKRQGTSLGSLLTGFLIGGAIGVAAAFLMAPQSGEETRAQIRDKTDELKERAKTTLDETRNRAEQAVSETRSRAEQMVAETRSRAGEKIQDISSRAEEVARKTRERGEEMTNQADAEMGQ